MKKPAGRPYADTRLVRYLEKRVLELRPRKTQTIIASEAGFNQPAMLTMVKRGAAKLPLDRVPALAKALECDPAQLFFLAIDQLGGDTTERAIRTIFKTIVTENEVGWLEEIRDASGSSDPRLTSKSRAQIRGIFGK